MTLSFILMCTLIAHGKKTWTITDFGAVADGKTLNTVAIQKAVDKCAKTGGGQVIVPAGTFLCGTIELKNHVELHLEKGATLLGSKNNDDYKIIAPFVDATGQQRGKCFIGANKQQNIAISGEGIIDGQGKGRKGHRPFLVRLVGCNQATVQGVTLRQPAAWTLHLQQSSNILVDGIHIYSHANRNNDGIDIDSSHDVEIRNSVINSGDDAVCIKATTPDPTYNVYVHDCDISTDWGGIKFGTESMGDFHHIVVERCTLHDIKGGAIKLLSMDGANIHDIVIQNLCMKNVEMPIFVRLGERLRTYTKEQKKRPVGSISKVLIRNVQAAVRAPQDCRVEHPSGMLITGTPNHKISDLTIEDFHITLDGTGTEEDCTREVPEDIKRYPEFSFFGILPASGIYARHIEQLTLKNVDIDVIGQDKRPLTYFEDVNKLFTRK